MYADLTNIDTLRSAYAEVQARFPDSHFFISNWDFDVINLNIRGVSLCDSDIYRYQFPPFLAEHKELIRNSLQLPLRDQIDLDNFAILGNGTSAFLLLVLALAKKQATNWLCIAPVYFSHLNALEELNANISIIEAKTDALNNFHLDMAEIERVVSASKIQVILITNPFFGTGQELDETTLDALSDLANSHGILLVIDDIYGGMGWSSTEIGTPIIDERMISLVSRADRYALFESISKKTLTNGAKTALIFSTSDIVSSIESHSLYTTGSLCGMQLELLELLYSDRFRLAVTSYAESLLNSAQSLYARLKTLERIGTFKLFPCNSGYYALGEFRKAKNADDMAIAHSILEKTGILTIPHSRYLLTSLEHYRFRINLLGDEGRTIRSLMEIAYLGLLH